MIGELDALKTYDENIIGSIEDGMIVLDKDGRIEKVNNAAMKMTGFEEKELIGKNVDDFINNGKAIAKLFKNQSAKLKLTGCGNDAMVELLKEETSKIKNSKTKIPT